MQRVRSRLSGYNINSKVLQFVLQLSRADLSLSSEIQSGDGGSKPAIEGGSFQLKVESPFPSIRLLFAPRSRSVTLLESLEYLMQHFKAGSQKSLWCACMAENCIVMHF